MSKEIETCNCNSEVILILVMIIRANFSAGFAPPFSMLQASGSQFPPPQHLYGGGYQPTLTPSEFLQQGMNRSRSSPNVPVR